MRRTLVVVLAVIGLAVAVGSGVIGSRRPAAEAPGPGSPRPALTVEVVQPELRELPLTLPANGSIAAWQEAVIGAEVGGLRLQAVQAQVGDRVRKGQVLAVFDGETVVADVAQSRAAVAEAEARLAEARANAERVRQVLDPRALSALEAQQYLTAEKTAAARVQSAKAQLDQQLLRLRHIRVEAPDDGVISARQATLGAVVAAGQELFRLIRQNRLEWRAELTANELLQVHPGAAVVVEVPGAPPVEGRVRMVGPTLDAQSRNALVYVDLPGADRAGLRPGMFAHGEFKLGRRPGLTVPQTALTLREGMNYVFRLSEFDGAVARADLVKVQLGRRGGDRVEILEGVGADDRLVASGAAFLTDGDRVRVVRP